MDNHEKYHQCWAILMIGGQGYPPISCDYLGPYCDYLGAEIFDSIYKFAMQRQESPVKQTDVNNNLFDKNGKLVRYELDDAIFGKAYKKCQDINMPVNNAIKFADNVVKQAYESAQGVSHAAIYAEMHKRINMYRLGRMTHPTHTTSSNQRVDSETKA